MSSDSAVALAAAILAAAIGISVPWFTFHLALWQDKIRWLREQRSQLYVDLLTEAHAERAWRQYATADDRVKELMRDRFTDLRLQPLEHARLGARGTIFGSATVNRLFSELLAGGREQCPEWHRPSRADGGRYARRRRNGQASSGNPARVGR
jgi:hypothetical protein